MNTPKELSATKPQTVIALRFLLACAVILHHCYGLQAKPLPLQVFSRGQETLGVLAVACFFALSGFLVTQSYLHLHSWKDYLWRRALRIFPGFWAALASVIFVFAPLAYCLQHHTLAGYFSLSPGPAEYFFENFFLKMNQHSIGNLLAHNPYPKIWNGSLWSLALEFCCYLLILGLGAAGLFKNRKFFMIFFISSAAVYLSWGMRQNLIYFSPSFPRMIWSPVYFLGGSICYLYRDKIPYTFFTMTAASFLFILTMAFGFYVQFSVLLIPYLVTGIIRVPFPFLRGIQRDFSYGIYLYAFPIQQILIAFGWQSKGMPALFLLGLALAFVPAALNHFLIEVPCQKYK